MPILGRASNIDNFRTGGTAKPKPATKPAPRTSHPIVVRKAAKGANPVVVKAKPAPSRNIDRPNAGQSGGRVLPVAAPTPVHNSSTSVLTHNAHTPVRNIDLAGAGQSGGRVLPTGNNGPTAIRNTSSKPAQTTAPASAAPKAKPSTKPAPKPTGAPKPTTKPGTKPAPRPTSGPAPKSPPKTTPTNSPAPTTVQSGITFPSIFQLALLVGAALALWYLYSHKGKK